VARVLVVEDDSTVSSVLSAYLRKAGFDPRIAADGGGWHTDRTGGQPLLYWFVELQRLPECRR